MDLAQVKSNLNKTVYYEGEGFNGKYLLNACILRKNKNGKFYYQLELLDTTCNHSVLIVPVDKVKVLN